MAYRIPDAQQVPQASIIRIGQFESWIRPCCQEHSLNGFGFRTVRVRKPENMPVRMVLEALGRQIHIELGGVEPNAAITLEGHLYTVYIQSLRNEILGHCGFQTIDRKLVRALVVSLDIGSDLPSVNSVLLNRNPTL